MSLWSDLQNKSMGKSIRKEDRQFLEADQLDETELESMLKKGIVHFQYRKKPAKGKPEDSGVIRDAWGTRQMDVVNKVPHGGECEPKKVGYIVYFDLDKGDWRVFWPTRLVGTWKKIYTYEEYEFEKASEKK